MIIYAETSRDAVANAISKAIDRLPTIDPLQFHQRLSTMYAWSDIAERTEVVYNRILKSEQKSLAQRLSKYHNCGPFAGKIAVLVMVIDYLLLLILEWLVPRESIDLAPKFDPIYFKEYCREQLNTQSRD